MVAQQQQASNELQNLRGRIEQTQVRIDTLQEEHGSNLENQAELDRLKRLKKNLQAELKNKKKEIDALQKIQKQQDKEQAKVDTLRKLVSAKEKGRNDLKARLNATKPLDTLKEQIDEMEKQNEEDRRWLDENPSSSERPAVEARVADRNEELARLRTQVQEREEALPLRERIKNIFKKYGWTLQAVVLAAGITISAVVLATLNGLKAATKAIGNGLKNIGKQAAGALPGLIGLIVSFIFKVAGQAISFLAKHAWLLILAVVAFLVERVTKRARS